MAPSGPKGMIDNLTRSQMTWPKAVIAGLVITAILIVVLGFIPSIFRYEWGKRSDDIAEFIKDKTGYEFKDRYTLVRIHDAISMGYQTTVFAIPLVLTYIMGEKKRRRLGQGGASPVKGYLPGK
ncbi:MAG: hypothetical protein ACRDIU_06120 [Actinomycetota bacterium]